MAQTIARSHAFDRPRSQTAAEVEHRLSGRVARAVDHLHVIPSRYPTVRTERHSTALGVEAAFDAQSKHAHELGRELFTCARCWPQPRFG